MPHFTPGKLSAMVKKESGMKYLIAIPTVVLFLLFSYSPQIYAQSRSYKLSLVFSSGDATINDRECGWEPRICILKAEGNAMGLPLGKVKYSTQLTSFWTRAYPNGRDGFCAPTEGEVVMSNQYGTVNALFQGSTCDINFQSERLPHLYDGQFTVTSGTGKYAGAAGTGVIKGWDTKSRIAFSVKGEITY